MPKKFEERKVLSCYKSMEGSEIYYLKLLWNGDMPRPGQFIMIAPAQGSGMKRPFAVHCAIYEDNFIAIAFNIVGKNTKLYSKLKTGDKIKAAGPLGKPFVVDDKYENYILVGGGMGFAPLSFLASGLNERKKTMRVLLGAQRPEQLNAGGFMPYVEPFKCRISTITEKGRVKTKGLVTDLLEQELRLDKGKSMVIACGPVLMLEEVAKLCKAKENKCLVFLEEMMACGIGSCKSCAVFCKNGKTKHVCSDGPIFDAEEIDWGKLISSISNKSLAKTVQETDNPMRIILRGQEGRTLTLDSPIMPASGCISIEAAEQGGVDISRFGAIITKGKTLLPSFGNPTPRVCETSEGGMINSIGLENLGIDNFVSSELDRWLRLHSKIIVNISGSTIEEYVKIACKLPKDKISGVEVNISCPNVDAGKMIFGTSPKLTFGLITALRKEIPHIFMIVKLTPYAGSLTVDVAKKAVEAGADCIAFSNTYPSMAIDVYSLKPKIAVGSGGQSGRGIHGLSVKAVYDIAQANLGVPIIGVGGIFNHESAAEFFVAGASAVAIGTELLFDPDIGPKIYNGLLGLMEYHKISWIGDLISTLRMK